MTHPSEQSSSKRGIILSVMVMGAFVAILNQTLMNVALPQIMDDFKVSANTVQWLTTGYMLVNGVLIPVTAFFMERFTTRQLFITAMSLFILGTLICGVAPVFSVLIIGRMVQAAGAGIMMPLMTQVILTMYPIAERGTAMGVVGVAMIFAPAIGPTLSGWIVQEFSWRLLFFTVLPVAVLDLILAIFLLKNVTKQTFPKMDTLGVVLSTLGFGGLLYGFSSAGEKGWTSLGVIVTLVVGVIALLLFIWRQFSVQKPMLEFRVFKYSMFSLTTLINALITMAMFSAMILLPIYLQSIRGFTPMESGMLLLPGSLLMGIMSPITGKIFDRIGARWLGVIGLGITAVTTWEFSHLTDSTTYTHLLWMYTLRMFGMSMIMMPIMTAGLNQLPQQLNAHGNAMSNTIRQVSGALGTALLVTVMSNQTQQYLKEMTTSSTTMQQMAHLTKEATIQGINDAFFVATALSVVAFVLAFFIRKASPPEEEQTEGQDESNLSVSKG